MTYRNWNIKFNSNVKVGLFTESNFIGFLVLLVLLLKSLNANAGIEPELRVFRTGSGLVLNDTMNIYDHIFMYGDGTTTSVPPSNYHLRKCKTYITLEINQETIKDCNLSSFVYSVTLNLSANDQNGNPITLSPVTLQIDYDKTTGTNYKDKHTIEIDGAYWLSAEISSLGNPALNDFVKISLGMVIERYQDIVPANHPTFNTIIVDASKNEFVLSWQTQQGSEEYDLEWAWYDDYPSTGTTPLASSAIGWTFANNASRVTVKGNSYKFSNIFC